MNEEQGQTSSLEDAMLAKINTHQPWSLNPVLAAQVALEAKLITLGEFAQIVLAARIHETLGFVNQNIMSLARHLGVTVATNRPGEGPRGEQKS